MSERVLSHIPVRGDRGSLSRERSRSNSPVHSKRKSYLSESGEEKDEYSKKKHKKSKKKDKHKDKDKEKSKKKEKKHYEEEMTAIEKFNMFKKQREEGKGEDRIVDDLFKDFIASKLKQIESDNDKTKEKSKSKKSKEKKITSVVEMNKFLDNEINNIAQPDETTKEPSITEKDKVKTADLADKVKLENTKPVATVRKLNAVDSPINVSSLIKGMQNKLKENLGDDKACAVEVPKVVSDISIRKAKDVPKASPVISNYIPLPSGPAPAQENLKVAGEKPVENDQKEKEKSLPVYGPLLPRSIAISEKFDSVEEPKVEIKKPLGFKNFGIKLSATSAELIQSGEVHTKGKRLEEGEVLSSSSGGSDSSDSDPDDDDDDDAEISGTGSLSDSDGESKTGSKSKKKKKKKKKLKQKKKKKHKEKDKEKDKEGVLVVGKDKSASKRKVSITPRSRSRSPKKSRRSRSKSRSKDRSKRRSRSRSKEKKRSRRSRSRSRGRRSRSRGRRSRSRGRRSRSRGRRSRSRSRGRRSRSRGRRSRSRSKSPDRFWRSKYGNFDAYKFFKGKRDRSRSRSPERERDKFIDKERKRLEDLRHKIDKAKLREIAIKNALTNAKSGGLQLDVAIKSGGKSVEELTEYCKKIQEKEKEKKKYKNQYESSSEEELPKHSDDEDMLHHPFIVKEAGSITFDIKDSKQLPVATPQERIAQNTQLRITYPVSSGSQHREKEWVPVEPDPAPAAAKPKPNTGLSFPALMPPPAPPLPKQEVKVFDEPPDQPSTDISSIVSERLTAMKQLQDNPHDIAAKIILEKAQMQASQWAASKNLPGQFLGSTGANILSHDELIGNKKRQAWLKKDVFSSAAPVSGGIGMFLLQKMGWKHGEGLGKNNEGTKEPILLDFKIDRKGLVTTGEGKKGSQPKVPVVRDLSGKHPVSALGELCNKRRWGPPHYEMVHESGPAHRRDFLFKVKVNGTAYQPSITSNNKKLAKAQAATVVLQELGLVPRNAT